MSRIRHVEKAADVGQVRYLVETNDGDLYLVIQAFKNERVIERVYFLTMYASACLRLLEYPSHQMPKVGFKDFIEGQGLAS